MPKGFWGKIRKPIFVSAPMSNVTDVVFRELLAKHGKPDAIWTEFIPCDALCMKEVRKKFAMDLKFTNSQRPVVAQIFGSNPENFFKSAKILKRMGFDGIDINMGCPDISVEKQKAGAQLMLKPELAQEIIRQTKLGAGDLPVSVKTRIGYNEPNIKEWFSSLAKAEPIAIIIHGRTKKELSKVPADWKAIKAAGKIIKQINKNILVIGNGDVKNLAEAEKRIKQAGVDGVMVGRALIGNPWFFNKRKKKISAKEKLTAVLKHAELFEQMFGKKKNFDEIKKHLKAYVNNFVDAAAVRVELMDAKNAKAVKKIVNKFC